MKNIDSDRVLPTEAAKILETSTLFVYLAMQQGKLPIGVAVKTSTKWTYHISAKLLEEYTGKDIKAELQKIRKSK